MSFGSRDIGTIRKNYLANLKIAIKEVSHVDTT